MGQTLAFSFILLFSALILSSAAATKGGEGKGSFFNSGGYDEHVEVAKLVLKAATNCDYGYRNDQNFLTCASEDNIYHHGHGSFQPIGSLDPARVGWCTIKWHENYPIDNTYNVFIGDFIADCHISSDAHCADSLGCSNLDIAVLGQAYELYTNVVVAVDPSSTFPPYAPACPYYDDKKSGTGGSSKDEAHRRRGDRKRNTDKSLRQASKPINAKILSSYGYDEPLPATVWIIDPDYIPVGGDDVPAALVFGGQASVFDLQTKRQLATGWMDFAQLWLNENDDGTKNNNGWKQIPSSEIPLGAVVIRAPYQYKFTFTKEVKHVPYAN